MKYYKAIIFSFTIAAAFLFWLALPEPSDYAFYIRNFIAAVVYIIAYLALGIKIQKFLKIDDIKMKYPFAFAISAGFYGTLFFIIGLVSRYSDIFALVILLATLIFCYREVIEIYFDFLGLIKGFIGGNKGLTHKIFYIGGGFALIYLFAAALTPPVYYDTLVYHLAVPEQYIQAGRIINMKENVFSYFPQLMGMNFLFLLLLTSELGVKIMFFFMAIMALTAIAGLADEMKADKNVSVLLLLTCPLFLLNTSRIGAELPLMFFTLLLVYLLVKAMKTGMKTGGYLLAGLISGMIMSVKYTGALSFIYGAIFLAYCFAKKKLTLANLLVYIFTPVLVVLPYLARNWSFTGDPFYPFLTGIFNMDPVLKTDASSYVSHVAGFGLPHTFANLLLAAIKVSADKEMVFGGDVLSPMYLLALAMLPFTDIKKTGMPALFIGFYFITWFFTGQVLRFLMPIVPVAAVIAGNAYANAGSKLKYFAFGALLFVQTEYSIFFGERYMSPFQLISIERSEFIFNNVTYLPAVYYIDANTKPGSGVLVIGDARTFYLERPALAYTVFNRNTIFEGFDEAGEDMLPGRLRQRNTRYILINWKELDRLKAGGFNDAFRIVNTPKFKAIMEKYFTKVFNDSNCEVYEMKDGI